MLHQCIHISDERIRLFHSHVSEPNASDCMLWLAACTRDGYGVTSIKRKQIRAHRLAYYLAFGPISDDLQVLHQCDVPRCVNPAHMFLGTNHENCLDCVSKGRNARGQKIYRAKLTPALVKEIRRRYAAGGIFQYELAAEYGMTQGAINKVIIRATWKHVE